MRIDFSRWVQQPSRAQSYFLFAMDEGYLNFCRDQLVEKLKVKHDMTVSSCRQEDLLEDPSPLQNQPSLFEPLVKDKILVIEEATDKATSLIALADSSVTLVFPVLSGTSTKKLKELHEKTANYQLISCYLNSSNDKSFFVRCLLQKYQVEVDAEAFQFLLQRVDEESEYIESHIQKCALYFEIPSILQLQDVQVCCGNLLTHNVNEVITALASKDRLRTIHEYGKAEQAGVEEIMLLRMLNSYFVKLLSLKSTMSQGKSAEEAIRTARPPIFFKQEPILKAQLLQWSSASILAVLERLRQREGDMKKGSLNAETSLERFLLSLMSL